MGNSGGNKLDSKRFHWRGRSSFPKRHRIGILNKTCVWCTFQKYSFWEKFIRNSLVTKRVSSLRFTVLIHLHQANIGGICLWVKLLTFTKSEGFVVCMHEGSVREWWMNMCKYCYRRKMINMRNLANLLSLCQRRSIKDPIMRIAKFPASVFYFSQFGHHPLEWGAKLFQKINAFFSTLT